MSFTKSVKEEYDNFLENVDVPASDELREAYNDMHTRFEDYINHISEESWISGYKYAVNTILSGGVQ